MNSAAVRFHPTLWKFRYPAVIAAESRVAPLTLSQTGTRRSTQTPRVNQKSA